MNLICGIDNGYSGYMVFIDLKTMSIHALESYPREEQKQLFYIFQKYKPIKVIMEQPFITTGFKGVSSSNYEILGRYSQTLEFLNIPYETVRVSTWRKYLGIKAKGREENKKASIQKAQELFNEKDFLKLHSTKNTNINHKRVPVDYVDDNKCESALIAYYATQKYLDKLKNE